MVVVQKVGIELFRCNSRITRNLKLLVDHIGFCQLTSGLRVLSCRSKSSFN